MARTKEYNKGQALENAMILFWAQGYTATSVQQLLDVMNINRSSMYAEFGNKRDLFMEVMALYNSLTKSMYEAISRADNPVEAVRNFYDIGFTQHTDKQLYQGCLLVNTILELRDVDNELSSIASNYFQEIEKAFARSFQNCALKGTLKQNRDPEMLAAFIMTVFKGMRVVARQKPSRTYLNGVLETALLIFQESTESKELIN